MSELQFARAFLTMLDNKSAKYQQDHVVYPATPAELRLPYTLPKLPHPPHPNPPAYSPSSRGFGNPIGGPARKNDKEEERVVTLHLVSPRNPHISLTLPSLPLTTPITKIKSALQTQVEEKISADKIKILLNKKPIPSSKRTLADAFDAAAEQDQEKLEDEVTLKVMVMGGATAVPAATAAAAAAAAGSALSSTSTSKPAAAAAAAASNTSTDQEEKNRKETIINEKVPTDDKGSEKEEQNDANWQDQLSHPAFWDDLQVFLQQRLHSPDGGRKLRAVLEKAWRADVVKIAT